MDIKIWFFTGNFNVQLNMGWWWENKASYLQDDMTSVTGQMLVIENAEATNVKICKLVDK